jgi:hypothetical protein
MCVAGTENELSGAARHVHECGLDGVCAMPVVEAALVILLKPVSSPVSSAATMTLQSVNGTTSTFPALFRVNRHSGRRVWAHLTSDVRMGPHCAVEGHLVGDRGRQ